MQQKLWAPSRPVAGWQILWVGLEAEAAGEY